MPELSWESRSNGLFLDAKKLPLVPHGVARAVTKRRARHRNATPKARTNARFVALGRFPGRISREEKSERE